MILWHQSGVNKNGEPFVQLFIDEKVVGQFTPEECREHASSILQAAEAAEQDAFLLAFHSTEGGLDIQQAAGLLIKFRQWREARGKKGPVSDHREFMITDKHQKPEGA